MHDLMNHLIHIIETNDDRFSFEYGTPNKIVVYDKEKNESFEITAKKTTCSDHTEHPKRMVYFKIHTVDDELIEVNSEIPLPETDITNEVKAILDEWLNQNIQTPIDNYDVIITPLFEEVC